MAGLPPLSISYVEGGLPPQHLWKTSDEYTKATDMYFTIRSQKIVLQGQPYCPIDASGTPFVSPNQWRVLCCALPDPNNFSISQQGAALSDRKYIWQLKGFRINREGELGSSIEQNAKFDPEWNDSTPAQPQNARNLTYTPPLQQTICVGCRPALGSTWVPQNFSSDDENKDFVERITEINDGDLIQVGFGNVDIQPMIDAAKELRIFPERYYPAIMVLNPDKKTKNLSDIAMQMEDTGDRDFIIIRREQCFSQQIVTSRTGDFEHGAGSNADIFDPNWSIPSGSVISSLNDIFNKTYWMNRAEHQNNCLAWDEKFYFTFCDNFRGRAKVFPISDLSEKKIPKLAMRYTYVFQVEAIVRLVEVKLEAELIQYLYRINRNLLNKWGYGWTSYPAPGVAGTNGNGTFRLGAPKHEEIEEEKEEITCLYVDMSGAVSSDMGSTQVGRHFKQLQGKSLVNKLPVVKPKAVPKSRAAKRKA